MKIEYVSRILVVILTMVCCRPCVADTTQRFLDKMGQFQVVDATNQLTVTATNGSDGKPWLTISWRVSAEETHTDAMPMVKDGGFVFVQNTSQIWAFDGRSLDLIQNNESTKVQSDTYLNKMDKSCPAEVRDALPASFRRTSVP